MERNVPFYFFLASLCLVPLNLVDTFSLDMASRAERLRLKTELSKVNYVYKCKIAEEINLSEIPFCPLTTKNDHLQLYACKL